MLGRRRTIRQCDECTLWHSMLCKNFGDCSLIACLTPSRRPKVTFGLDLGELLKPSVRHSMSHPQIIALEMGVWRVLMCYCGPRVTLKRIYADDQSLGVHGIWSGPGRARWKAALASG